MAVSEARLELKRFHILKTTTGLRRYDIHDRSEISPPTEFSLGASYRTGKSLADFERGADISGIRGKR